MTIDKLIWLVRSRIRAEYAKRVYDDSDKKAVDAFAMENDLERLPYCLQSAQAALLWLARLQSELVANLTPSPLPPGLPKTRVGQHATIDDPARVSMGAAIDAYLESSRRTMDALIPYVQRALAVLGSGKSMQGSMHSVVTNLSREPLGHGLDEPFIDFWKSSGALLKEYRDLAQHHAIVVSEPYIEVHASGERRIFLALPNNPAETSPKKRSFTPPIAAYPYCEKSFLELLGFCYEVMYILARLLGDDQQRTSGLRVVLTKDGAGTHQPRPPSALQTDIDARMLLIAGDCCRRHGEIPIVS